MTRMESGRALGVHGEFYRCLDASGCGLRFPVAVGDLFHDRCPRCGGAVQRVAVVEDTTFSTSPSTPAPSSSRIRLLLDNWRSLFNVGAAFRTADGAGLRHLYLCGITGTPASQPKLTKTALGAERSVPWSYHTDAVRLAEELQRDGAQLWVLERGERADSLFDINDLGVNAPLVLAAGNEVVGVDPDLLAQANRVIHLPMAGYKASLNVAVAVSVASYWLRAWEMAATQANLTR